MYDVPKELHHLNLLKMTESSFSDAIAYGLSVLTSSHLTCKEEQLLSVKAVYKGKDVFVWLFMRFGKSLC